MKIVESFEIPAEVERVFELVASPAGMLLFEGYGMIPGIAKVTSSAPERAVGVEDVITNSDGSTHQEHVVELEPPRLYAVEIGPFESPMRHLVTHLNERWELEGSPSGGTVVRREFRFHPRGPLRGLIVRWLLLPQMRAAMARNHRALAAAL